MITVEVSQILQEELSGVMDRVTSRLIARLKEGCATLHPVGGAAEMTTGWDLDVGTRIGKRRRALSAMDEEFEPANMGTGSQVSYDIYEKCRGTNGFSCHKFWCYKCGERVGISFATARRIECITSITNRVISNPTILYGYQRECKPKCPPSDRKSRLKCKKAHVFNFDPLFNF